MENSKIKNLVILSLIIGGACGIVASIPVLGVLMLCILMMLSAPFVILYLIMDSKMDLTTAKDSILNGALIGFCANLSFAVFYLIITTILLKIFNYSANLFLTTLISNASMGILLMFIIFVGILCATTNAFSGFATFYIINLIRDNYEKKHPVDNFKNNMEEYNNNDRI